MLIYKAPAKQNTNRAPKASGDHRGMTSIRRGEKRNARAEMGTIKKKLCGPKKGNGRGTALENGRAQESPIRSVGTELFYIYE